MTDKASYNIGNLYSSNDLGIDEKRPCRNMLIGKIGSMTRFMNQVGKLLGCLKRISIIDVIKYNRNIFNVMLSCSFLQKAYELGVMRLKLSFFKCHVKIRTLAHNTEYLRFGVHDNLKEFIKEFPVVRKAYTSGGNQFFGFDCHIFSFMAFVFQGSKLLFGMKDFFVYFCDLPLMETYSRQDIKGRVIIFMHKGTFVDKSQQNESLLISTKGLGKCGGAPQRHRP